MFYFTTVFTEASNQVTVYPYQPASYQVEAPLQLLQKHRRKTPLCIRFYDATEISPAARYNTVTGLIGCGLHSNPRNTQKSLSQNFIQFSAD